MKIIKILTTILLIGLTLTGCNSMEEIEEEYKFNIPIVSEKGYSIKTDSKTNEQYYIIENDYKEEHYIQEIFSDNYENNTYPELKTEGEILNYEEYIEYCKLFNVDPYYTDKNQNYLILSYGSSGSWIDVRLADIEIDETNKNIIMYIYEDSNGVMGSGSGYILTVPTTYSSEYNIEIKICITNEWFETITDEKLYEEYIYYQMCDKPVIYLYPEKETTLDIILDFKGTLTHTYPKYEDKWTITAYPDGTLIDKKGIQYKYLFWEGETDTNFDFSKGFCIKGEDTLEFLENSLTKLGLNYEEKNDFITYWLPQMESNPYNIISFQEETYTDIAKIKTSKKIDTEIRVFMSWKPSNIFVNIKEQNLKSTERNGFTLVEWGGTKVE